MIHCKLFIISEPLLLNYVLYPRVTNPRMTARWKLALFSFQEPRLCSHTNTRILGHAHGPRDVSRGNFPCPMSASDRRYVWLPCLTGPHFQLPLSFSILLQFLSLHVASVCRVFSQPHELSLILPPLPAVANSGFFFKYFF